VGKIVVSEFITIDGVIQAPGDRDEYDRGGWATGGGEEGSQFKYDELMASDAQLLGRLTYDGFAAAWPTKEGTGVFRQSLLELGLIDELKLMVFPVVIGKGKRLFGETGERQNLELADSRAIADGVLHLTYRRSSSYVSRESPSSRPSALVRQTG
jgi:dihydrofolate reductase